MREVGRRFARLDALVDQRIDRSRFFSSHGAVGGGIWRVRQVAVQGRPRRHNTSQAASSSALVVPWPKASPAEDNR